jgi:hypothetical protein
METTVTKNVLRTETEDSPKYQSQMKENIETAKVDGNDEVILTMGYSENTPLLHRNYQPKEFESAERKSEEENYGSENKY